MSKIRVASLFLAVLMLFSCTAIAETIMPRADSNFISATAFLAADKRVVFDCTTYDIYDEIRITIVWLEQEIDGEWVATRYLPAPTDVAEDTISYVSVAAYSSYIGTGTFRVGFGVDADGYTIYRYSNTRTF